MPWNNQGGGWQGGGGRGPWGQGGGGGQGRQPQSPDLEELLRKGQDRFRSFIPGGPRSPRAILMAILVIVVIWLLTGFYRVQPDEQGVVLRFGEWVNTTEPGLHYHLPSPIETVQRPKVTRVQRVEVGFRSGETSRRGNLGDLPEESLMLTGDENIVDIDFTVFWIIKDAGLFLFNVQDPAATVKNVAESAMRETIGNSQFQFVVAEGRANIEQQTREEIQKILDKYRAGIQINNVQLQKVDPPGAVIDAFRDVQRARADLETQVNEAETYQNDILPRARGEAVRLVQEAEAYKEQVVQTAEGDAQRFLAIYNEYKNAKEVTARRMYLETMEAVLGRMNKIVIDPSSTGPGGSGVVPYLPLNELTRPGARASTGGNQ